jgi:predicted deacylase
MVFATHGGFVELLVELTDKVQTGQKVAIQRNTFGEVVAEYTSEVAGEVAVRRTDATAEPGTLLLGILYNRTPPESAPYPE